MNLNTIPVTERGQAAALFRAYADAHRIRPNDNDLALMRTYRAMSKGLRVFDLVEAFRATGLDERGRPRLAVVRADARRANFRHTGRGGGVFAHFDLWRRSRRSHVFRGGLFSLPDQTFDTAKIPTFSGTVISAVVPTIPPEHRPTRSLAGYQILFEPVWEDVPHDPFLTRHLYGSLFVIVAEWDLTEVEQMILRMVERERGTR